ncbi:MAG: hypothetical protein RBU21_00555, partial [FCB group bacterium]|nr:hypothetical protein [FCB group bacterium]
MDADKQVEAYFGHGYTLEISSRGSGTVIGADVYTPFTQATLYPVAGLGWHFDHWEGDLTGSSNPATLDMNTSKTVTAVFVEDPQSAPVADPVVTINTVAVGHGRVDPTERRLGRIFLYSDSSPTGLPEPVTFFTAIPDSGARFDHWEGMIEGTDNPGFLWSVYPGTALAYPYYVRAVFVDVCNVDVSTEGEGAVSPGTGRRDLGQPSTFTATPAPGYRLHHWLVNGQVAGGDPTLTITPTADTTVVAVFTPVAALTLVAMPSGAGGGITADPLKDVYDPGDHVSLLAAPAAAWRFYRWEKNGAYAGDVNPLPLTVQDDTTVAAWFVQIFEFAATATAGGSVYPTQRTCDIGTTVAATATPDAGLVFVRWEGDVPENLRYQRHVVLTMDQNRAIQPVFGYALTASILGGGAIRIGEATAPLVTDAQTLRHIPLGQEVTLTAVNTENATFQHWIMPDGSLNTSATVQVTLSASSTFSAVFEPAETSPTGNVSLAVAVNGGGKVTVNAQGDKAVSNYGVFSYAPNSSVALTATPDEGYVFSRWSGDATGPDASLSVAMDGPKAVIAHFHKEGETEPEGYDLIVRVVGGGEVLSNGWHFPACSDDVAAEPAFLVAKPAFGWRFDHWEGDSTESSNVTLVSMDSDRTLVAVFVQPAFTLDISQTAIGGSVYVGPEDRWIQDMPDALNAGFAPGSQAQFEAIPEPGWEFSHWSGSLPSSYTSNSVFIESMGSHYFVQPVFTPLYPFHLITSSGGNVTVFQNDQPGTAVNTDQVLDCRPDTRLTLAATPAPGFFFDGWEGPAVPQDNPGGPATASVLITEPTEILPRFLPEQYEVTATASIPEGAEMVITPSKEHYQYGDPIEISAIPKPGFRFAGWEESIQGASVAVNPWRGIATSSIAAIAKIEGAYSLMRASVGGQGTVEVSPDMGNYCPGDKVELTAKAA